MCTYVLMMSMTGADCETDCCEAEIDSMVHGRGSSISLQDGAEGPDELGLGEVARLTVPSPLF